MFNIFSQKNQDKNLFICLEKRCSNRLTTFEDIQKKKHELEREFLKLQDLSEALQTLDDKLKKNQLFSLPLCQPILNIEKSEKLFMQKLQKIIAFIKKKFQEFKKQIQEDR